MADFNIFDADQGAFVDPNAVQTFDGGAGAFQDRVVWRYDGTDFVIAFNQPPTASFTSATTNLTVNVDASESADPDSSIQSYAWDWGDGATGSGVTASHTYDSGGDYTITLTVTDEFGASDQAQQTVSVSSGGGGGDVLEDWESTGLGRYTGEKSWTQVDGSSGGYSITTNAIEGERSLRSDDARHCCPGGYHTIVTLEETTQEGESYSHKLIMGSRQMYAGILFGVQSTSDPWPCYRWRFDNGGGEQGLSLERIDAGGPIESHLLPEDQILVDHAGEGPPTEEILTLEWTWDSSGIPFTVTRADGSTHVSGTSDPDSTYSSGGIGYMTSSSQDNQNNDAVWDAYIRTG